MIPGDLGNGVRSVTKNFVPYSGILVTRFAALPVIVAVMWHKMPMGPEAMHAANAIELRRCLDGVRCAVTLLEGVECPARKQQLVEVIQRQLRRVERIAPADRVRSSQA